MAAPNFSLAYRPDAGTLVDASYEVVPHEGNVVLDQIGPEFFQFTHLITQERKFIEGHGWHLVFDDGQGCLVQAVSSRDGESHAEGSGDEFVEPLAGLQTKVVEDELKIQLKTSADGEHFATFGTEVVSLHTMKTRFRCSKVSCRVGTGST